MSKADLAILWAASGLAALATVCGKLAMLLYGIAVDPPSDIQALNHWTRRRRWLAVSELAAVPCFATFAVAATEYWHLPPAAAVIISMLLGALGFGFLLHALQNHVRRKLGMDQ